MAFLLLWSGGFAFAALGLEHAETMTFLAMRYAVVLAVLAPLVMALAALGVAVATRRA